MNNLRIIGLRAPVSIKHAVNLEFLEQKMANFFKPNNDSNLDMNNTKFKRSTKSARRYK